VNEQALGLDGQETARYIPQNLSDAVAENNGIVLVPYGEVNGARSVGDDLIIKLYHELDMDGVIDTVFNDEMTDSARFVRFMKDPGNLPVFILVGGGLMGVGWLNNIKSNYAMGHFAFVKRSWGERSLDMGRRILKYWFSFPGDYGPLFDVLIGNIPAQNRAAIRYIKKLGFVEVGEIPHIAEGGAMSVSYIER